jgi:hypothetical protein
LDLIRVKKQRQRTIFLCVGALEFAAMPRVSRVASLAAFLAAGACSSSTSPDRTPPTIPPPLHGEVTDPAGDAIRDARVPVAPDLVRATADVVAGTGSVTFVIQFATGTFNRQMTHVSVLLDTDQNGSTGVRQVSGLGADFGVDLDAGTGQAAVTKANPANCDARLSCFDGIGLVPLTLAADGMQVTVPLSLLGNDDGRLNFQMSAYVMVAPQTPVVVDFMPDSNLPPGRIQ